MTPRLAVAAILLTLFGLSGAAAQMRVCDRRLRHVDCSFSGGGHLVAEVPPDEILTYGSTTLAFSDHGRVRIVVGNCQIDCAKP